MYTQSGTESFNEICRRYRIKTGDIQTSLFCVLKALSEIKENQLSDKDAYSVMQSATSTMARFPGDQSLFEELYQSISRLNPHDTLELIAATAIGRFQMVAPPTLIEFFCSHITESTHSIFVPECENYGPMLYDLIKSKPDIRFTVASRNIDLLGALAYVYRDLDNVTICEADIYREGFSVNRYDLIIALPVFGARHMADDQDFISHDSDMVALQNLLYHISLEGELLIVLPARVLFAGDSIASLRSYIETNYSIKEIDALPPGLFSPYTSIRTYAFAFGNGVTEEVLIRRYRLAKAADTEVMVKDIEEILFPDEFADLNGWNIDVAFGDVDDEIRKYNQSSVRKVQIHDIATVFRGKAVNSKESSGRIGLINISDLNEAGIMYDHLEMFDEEERKVARYALQEGDVLVTSRGTTIKVAVFEQQSFTCIPSANFNVIRPGTQIRGGYLKVFLESSLGMKLLKGLQRGSAVMNINFKDLNMLEVPLISIAEQDSLVDEYMEAKNFYLKTITEAKEKWVNAKEKIYSSMF